MQQRPLVVTIDVNTASESTDSVRFDDSKHLIGSGELQLSSATHKLKKNSSELFGMAVADICSVRADMHRPQHSLMINHLAENAGISRSIRRIVQGASE